MTGTASAGLKFGSLVLDGLLDLVRAHEGLCDLGRTIFYNDALIASLEFLGADELSVGAVFVQQEIVVSAVFEDLTGADDVDLISIANGR